MDDIPVEKDDYLVSLDIFNDKTLIKLSHGKKIM